MLFSDDPDASDERSTTEEETENYNTSGSHYSNDEINSGGSELDPSFGKTEK